MGQLEKLVERFLRLPPEASYDDVARLLESFGYTEFAAGGSHRVFRKAGCYPITVPTKKGRKVKRVYVKRIVELLALEEWYEEHRGT